MVRSHASAALSGAHLIRLCEQKTEPNIKEFLRKYSPGEKGTETCSS
jgi:hypothetical protein